MLLGGPGRRCVVLMNQSSRDDTLQGVRPSPGPGRGAVSPQSSRDKRTKRSLPGSTVRKEGRAISDRPLIPLRTAVCLGVVAAVASRSALAAGVAWSVVLAAVYAADPGPALTAMSVTAVALFPLAAWLGASLLHALDRGLRSVLVAALGRVRALLADVLTVLLAVVVAGAFGVLAPVLFDPVRPTARDVLVGAALHLGCGGAGVALAGGGGAASGRRDARDAVPGAGRTAAIAPARVPARYSLASAL